MKKIVMLVPCMLFIIFSCSTTKLQLSETQRPVISESQWRGYASYEVTIYDQYGYPSTLNYILPNSEGPYEVFMLYHPYTALHTVWMDDDYTHGHHLTEELLKQGYCVAFFDLPYHGRRYDEEQQAADSLFALSNYKDFVKQIQSESELFLQYLSLQEYISIDNPSALGYSLGSAVILPIAAELGYSKIVLCVPPHMYGRKGFGAPMLAAPDITAPILILAASRDEVIENPDKTEDLFDAISSDDKTLIWLDGGHSLPDEWVGIASQWIAEH